MPYKYNPAVGQCCTGNSARAVYYVWQNILTYADGRLRVNLLLNRASPWADVNSYIPYQGQVDVKIKVPCDLSVRLPDWVSPKEMRCRVADTDRSLSFDGRYAKTGQTKPGDTVRLTFPIKERDDVLWVEKRRYQILRKGNDVVSIDPPGVHGPLYQRAHYRQPKVHWRKVKRFIADQTLHW